MKDTARVVFTWDCPRDCWKCCNKQDWVHDAQHIKNIKEVLVQQKFNGARRFDKIVITGGEPLKYPVTLLKLLKQINAWPGRPAVYLQTNIWSPRMEEIAPYIQGVNYSIHNDNITEKDWDNFRKMQACLEEWPNGAHNKLWIDYKVFGENDMSFHRDEEIWDQIYIGAMVDDCPLPDNEKLFILESTVL